MTKRLLMMMSLTMAIAVSAQDAGNNQQSKIDTSLARHDFFYAGQSKQRRMFIVKDGQVNWSYQDQLKRGEISDAVLMSDGHILLAHQYGIAEVDAQGTTVWNYAAPEGTEIHTIQPIGTTHVVFVQNGKPAKAVVMEIPSTRIVREFELPIAEKGSVHGQFRNATQSAIVLINLPLALIGGVMALVVTGGELSIPAIIGFISLFGIATRNGMLLIDQYNGLVSKGMDVHTAVLNGSLDRLTPILMTAFTSALALVPLSVGSELPGNEIQSPMAKVMLGGLVSSTFLNMFVVPLIYRKK